MHLQLTHDRTLFETHAGSGINYSHEEIPSARVHIAPHGILHEKGVRPQQPQYANHPLWQHILFPGPGTVPFDLFAAFFFLVSRYEEYLPYTPDMHGRYPSLVSTAHKHGFLHLPVADQWAWKLAGMLVDAEMSSKSIERKTLVDIDFAYKYRGYAASTLLKKAAGSLARGWVADCVEQWSVMMSNSKDPYDTYGYITSVVPRDQLHYFVLMAACGGNDKNIPPASPLLRKLVATLAQQHVIGIHPSYRSNMDVSLLRHEMKMLEDIVHREVSTSRQHFLRMKMPATYQLLATHGIRSDYSMQYSGASGFRASTAWPFHFFNVESDEITGLLVHPVCTMDVTMNLHERMDAAGAVQHCRNYLETIRGVGGSFITAWHNSTLTGKGEWKGWREVFEQVHQL
jgi:hypothetical protein